VASQATDALLGVLKATQKPPCLGFATGSTPEKTYQQLLDRSAGLDLQALSTFNLDEYVGLEPTDPQSYAFYMQNKVFKILESRGLQPHNQHLFLGTSSDLAQTCVDYEFQVQSNPPDVWLLGLGHNGHVAFNEPGSAPNCITRVVTLDQETRQANARLFENQLDAVPSRALTVGIKTIMRARRLLMVVTGEGKAEALSRLQKETDTRDFPASFLKNHANFSVLADQKAAKFLV
jgi:glucosamine-6-phosphate deaminase